MRYAIYFTPAPGDPLSQVAARWLGRDAFGGEAFAPSAQDGLSSDAIAGLTSDPRRYGFHATIKAPFRLAEALSEADLVAALDDFCAGSAPFDVPDMTVGMLDGFFAIVPGRAWERLDRLAGEVVAEFERFRAPLTPAEIARRDPERLDPTELQNLHDWGYPYVFDRFGFHMTLTNRVAPEDRDAIGRALEALFGPVLAEPLTIDGLALFVEPEPGAPFGVRRYVPFGAASKRKTA